MHAFNFFHFWKIDKTQHFPILDFRATPTTNQRGVAANPSLSLSLFFFEFILFFKKNNNLIYIYFLS
jgi:hypothetical protein